MGIEIFDHGENRTVTLDQLRGAAAAATRTSQIVAYRTNSHPVAVYYTSLLPNGNTLTPRTSAGVSLVNGLYTYSEPIYPGLTDFAALWDEGDPADYFSMWVVVDR